MKTILARNKWVLVLSPILAAIFLICCYSAIARARGADTKDASSAADVSAGGETSEVASRPREDDDAEYIQKRQEYLNQFYGTGPGQVSSADFAASLAVARSVPPSPLLAGQSGVSGIKVPLTPQPWTYPLLPPLYNFWDPTRGASVRIDAIAVHPTDPDILYVGSEGGLATSTDGGDHWTYLSDALSSQSIRSIAVDPVAPNIIYAGTGTQEQFAVGMFRSFDSGATWDIVGATEFASSTICKILVDPATAGSESKTTLYAGVVKSNGTHTIWKSEDSGGTWAIFFGPTSGSGSGAFAFYDIAYDPSGRLYLTAPSGVYRYGPGNYWTFIHNIPNSGANSFLALDNQGAVYLAWVDGVTKIAKSTSYGNFWTELPASGADLMCFGVDPVHPSRIFVGGYPNANVYDLRYTLNGGTTWLTAGGLHPDLHAFAVAPLQPPAPQRYYLGGDGGIHRADYPNSNPSSISFFSKSQNLAGILTQGVSISRDDRVLIGTQDNSNQIYRPATPPWAAVFNQFLSGDGERPFIEFENNTEKMYVLALMPAYVVPNIGAPCRIINNSASSVTPPGAINEYTIAYSAMSVQFKVATNSDRVIMGFQHVWRSVDSGNNWTRIGGTACPGPSPSATPNHNCGIASNRRVTSVCEAPSDSNYIYAVLDYGAQIFKTTNANAGTGATWQDITRNLAVGMSPDGISRVVVHPTDPLTVYLAGSHYVHKTSDGGATNWVNEAVGPDFVFRDVVFHPADPSQVLVASHRGVYHRVNGTWTSLSYALPEGMAWWGLSFNHYSHQLAAAGYGRGVYTIDLDRVAPTATVNSPASGAHVRGTITVLGTAGDNHLVASAQLKLDGGNFPPGGGDTPDPNVSANWNTTMSTNGSHVLTLVVYDPYGNHTTSAGVTVTVDNLAPTVSITDPEDGKEVSGKMSVSATASDNVGVAGVQFYLDGDSLGSEVTSEPFSTDWDTTSTKGEHTLVAIARDEAGNTTTSNNVTVKVKN
jgi:hypothetical protein